MESDKRFQELINQINGKWDLIIINMLKTGEFHFNELLKNINGITPKALSDSLKKLLAHGIIEKDIKNINPVNIVYKLTEKGNALINPINSLVNWQIQCDKKR
ncbi:helix-turn-helix domain-containing protein [Acidiplasma sp.]|uniref:winged helix-turn-helix transcriptional regulator n=1 Tax=Acidiplasma sp. TaxID=1872114 RepID=UPI002590E4DE|nr:helix-turn-helix domain-containing protein [Acidiplasma sp.]